MQSFFKASGLDANKEKSQIFFFNTCKVTKCNILHILEYPEGSLPTKYLGAPLAESIVKQISWKDIFDKMKHKVSCWTFRSLNLPSRVILVKAVLQAMPTYLFSILAAPKDIIKKFMPFSALSFGEGLAIIKNGL